MINCFFFQIIIVYITKTIGRELHSVLSLSLAIRAETLDHIVDRLSHKTLGQLHLRNLDIAQTEGTMAMLAVEMRMLVLEGAFIMSATYLIL